MKLIYLPFIIQGIVMLIDEFYFHERRGLPKWERFGHPLDTMTVMMVLGYLIWAPVNLYIYVGLAAFSCLFITKDEFIHEKQCPGMEHWLHSLLFVLHPITFIAAYFLWEREEGKVLLLQFSVISLFFIYQLLRWGPRWSTQL